MTPLDGRPSNRPAERRPRVHAVALVVLMAVLLGVSGCAPHSPMRRLLFGPPDEPVATPRAAASPAPVAARAAPPTPSPASVVASAPISGPPSPVPSPAVPRGIAVAGAPTPAPAVRGIAVAGASKPAAPAASPVAGVAGPLPDVLLDRGDPARGQVRFTSAGCLACHTVMGTGGNIGPDLSEVATRAPGRAAAQGLSRPELYFVQSIVYPTAYVVEGYIPVMLDSKQMNLNEQDLADLAAYLSTLTGP